MNSHRPIVMSDAGMVVSGHHKASEAGAAVLRDGGNAIDAAVATSAVLAVAIPHMNGLGGDAIALYRDAKSGRTFAINGSGCAPRSLSPHVVLEAGHERMPMRGPLSVSVPGLVHAWEAVLAQFGTRPLASLLGPAIALARVGVPLDPVLTEYFNGRDYEGLAAEFPTLCQLYGAPGDRRLGERLRNSALSGTLTEIAAGGAATFYSGDIGRRLLADIREQGVQLDADDLTKHQTRIGEPLSVAFAGRRLHVAPPNSQGIALAVMAGLTEFRREEPGSVPPVRPADFLVRKQLAFGCREEIDDCSLRSGPIPELTRAYFRELSQAAGPAAGSSTHGGDTSTLVVLDGRGNSVSWVQSLFEDFGSGIVSTSTGIVMHNRLSLQGLRPDEPWPLRGGGRPFHTLCPAILERDGRCEMTLATPGDHGQPQTIMQILLRVLGEGMSIQAAIEAPRLRHDTGRTVMIENRAPAEWRREIAGAGYEIAEVGPWSRVMGGANAILRPPDGPMMAGADPRRTSYAIAAD